MKKAFPAALPIILLSLGTLVSCGGSDEPPYTTYEVSEYSLPEDFTLNGIIEVTDKRIYAMGREAVADSDGEISVCSIKATGKDTRHEPFVLTQNGTAARTLHSDGVGYYVEELKLGYDSRSVLINTDRGEVYDCSTLFGIDTAEVKSAQFGDEGFKVRDLKAFDGYLIVAANAGAAMLDLESGNTYSVITERGLKAAAIIEPDKPEDIGRVLALMLGDSENPISLVELDPILGTAEKLCDVPELADNQIVRCAFVRNDRLHILMTTGIYSIGDDGGLTLLVDFRYSGVYGNGVGCAMPLGNDEFVVTEYDEVLDTNRILRLSPIPSSRRREKTTLTLGWIMSDLKVVHLITMFNRQSEDFRVELIFLANDDNPYDLAPEYTVESLPDILCLGNSLDELRERLFREGAFYDLYTLIDADDGFSRDDLPEAAINSYEWDGKLIGITENKYPGYFYAISSNCKHPEAAWELLKLRLSPIYNETED